MGTPARGGPHRSPLNRTAVEEDVTMRRNLLGGIALVLFCGLVLCSCNDDDPVDTSGGTPGGTTPVYTASELETMGWESFALADYAMAVTHFEDALALQEDLHSARLGLGWSLAYAGDHAAAVEEFDALLDAGALTTDAYAGKAAALLFSDPAAARSNAEQALSMSAEYVFSYHESFDALSLHIMIAQASYALQEYSAAQAKVDELEIGYGLTPNGLDPQDPLTWIVGEATYPSYAEALAVVIQLLPERLAAEVPGIL